jgi:hypothetical protein
VTDKLILLRLLKAAAAEAREARSRLEERMGLPRVTIYDRPSRSKAGRRKRAGRAVAACPQQMGLLL